VRTKRIILYAAVAGVFLAAGCGQSQMDKDREEARERWAESRAEMMLKLAEGAYEKGNLGRARQYVEEITRAGIPYAPAYVLAARLAAEMKDLEQALDYAQAAKAVDPESPEARYVLGTIQQTMGCERDALDEFAGAVELSPDVPRYALAEAEMLVAAGQVEAAARCLAEAAERMPGRADVHAALGDVLSFLGRHGEAAGSFRVALRLDPKEEGPKERLAMALFYSGACDEAERVLAELAESEPHFAAGWVRQMRADCLLALGRTGEARAFYQRQTGGAVATSRSLIALAQCDIIEDRLASARTFLEKVLAAHSQDAEANALMGYVLLAEGQPGEAVSHLKLALKDPACGNRETVEWLLARAEGRSVPPPSARAAPPAAATLKDTEPRDGPYTLAKPVNPS